MGKWPQGGGQGPTLGPSVWCSLVLSGAAAAAAAAAVCCTRLLSFSLLAFLPDAIAPFGATTTATSIGNCSEPRHYSNVGPSPPVSLSLFLFSLAFSVCRFHLPFSYRPRRYRSAPLCTFSLFSLGFPRSPPSQSVDNFNSLKRNVSFTLHVWTCGSRAVIWNRNIKNLFFEKKFFIQKQHWLFLFLLKFCCYFFLKTLINFLKFFFSDAYFFLYWEAPKYRSIFVSVSSCEVLLSGNLEIIYLPSNSFQCNLVHHRQILSLVLYQLWNAANVPLLFLLLTRGCSSTSSTHSTQQQHLIELIVT